MAEQNTDYVLYHGLNGYGITLPYLCMLIIILIVAVFAVFLNGVIVYILFGRDFRHDVSCILISHLALSDCVSGILLLYNAIYNFIHYKAFYECAARFGLMNGVLMNSWGIIFALTSERYIKIIYPYEYLRLVTPQKARNIAIISWLFCIIFCQAPLFGWNYSTSDKYCNYFGVFTKNFLLAFSTIIYTMFFLVLLMYGHILYIAYKQCNRIWQFERNHVNHRHKQMWWRPTRTALVIIGMNIISWLPSGIYVILATTDHLQDLSLGQKGTILTYVSSVIYLNCIANPLIYAFNIRKVSKTIRKMFKLPENKTFVTEFELKAVKDNGFNMI